MKSNEIVVKPTVDTVNGLMDVYSKKGNDISVGVKKYLNGDYSNNGNEVEFYTIGSDWNPEFYIRISSKYPFHFTFPCTDTEKASGRHTHQRAGLLIAAAQRVLPYVPPRGKPFQRMGRQFKTNGPGKPQGSQRQTNRPHISATQIRNDQKCHKEHKCRTKVIHQSQARTNRQCIDDKEKDISLLQQIVHSGCAHIHKTPLAKLRWLNGQRA